MIRPAKVQRIDALLPGEMGRCYRVGTFPGESGRQPHAYLRDYNPSWEGCVVYDVFAPSGVVAKRVAIKARAAHEREGTR